MPNKNFTEGWMKVALAKDMRHNTDHVTIDIDQLEMAWL